MRVPRRHSMTRRAEFSRVKKEGQSKAGRYLVLATLRDPSLEHLKLAFVTSRRVGKAVVRNRVRRRLRSIVSKHGDCLDPDRYLVMIARFRAGDADFQQLEQDWLQRAKRLRILGDSSISEPGGGG